MRRLLGLAVVLAGCGSPPTPSAPAVLAPPVVAPPERALSAAAADDSPTDASDWDVRAQSRALARAFTSPLLAAEAFDRPLSELGAHPRHPLLDAEGRVRSPTSCRDHVEQQTHLDVPAIDADADVLLDRLCVGLRLAMLARRARETYVTAFDVRRDGPRELPSIVAGRHEDERALRDEGDRGVATDRVAFCGPEAADGEPIVRDCVFVELLARADFDADGIEDLLLHLVHESGGGSFDRFGEFSIVTRREASGRLLRVAAP